jgi:hypothetical protein
MAVHPRTRPQVLFLHAGWAREYRGAADDPPQGTFGYIRAGNEDAVEALNFRIFRGRCYGYAPHQSIDLRRLGGTRDDEYVDGILVVWTATDPAQGGRYIVGWYRNARIHSHMQQTLRPSKDRREAIAEAAANDCHLVLVDQRTFFIPSRTVGWPGIASAFYASEKLSPDDLELIFAYIDGTPSEGFYPSHGRASSHKGHGAGWPTVDPELRAEVEMRAVEHVIAHYKRLGWTTESVEDENLGWDLDVRNGGRLLRVEVKGRRGVGAVELTPHEFEAMRGTKTRMSYRLAIVHNALSASPTMTIFEYAPASDTWVSAGGAMLALREKTGAIVSF